LLLLHQLSVDAIQFLTLAIKELRLVVNVLPQTLERFVDESIAREAGGISRPRARLVVCEDSVGRLIGGVGEDVGRGRVCPCLELLNPEYEGGKLPLEFNLLSVVRAG
jgi:hypothetical protein